MWASCLENGTDVATLACIPVVIKLIINAALAFSGVVALILIIISGYKLISSRGDPEKVANARKTLTYAILGIVLIFLSFFIVQLISQVTGVSQIANPTLGNP